MDGTGIPAGLFHQEKRSGHTAGALFYCNKESLRSGLGLRHSAGGVYGADAGADSTVDTKLRVNDGPLLQSDGPGGTLDSAGTAADAGFGDVIGHGDRSFRGAEDTAILSWPYSSDKDKSPRFRKKPGADQLYGGWNWS